MASSSSSSNFNSAFDSHSWKHEVFISFRGEDTRKGFVDHLYEALVQQGIQTYKDDKTLARGESIGPALFKAIEDSQIAVIVFSKNYANSSWCLDELAHIVECMENKGQIVMPVFYGVDPSDVRKQNGKYGEAFAKHECENKNNVEFWREALVKAGNLSGWVPKDFANGHEAVCIKDIVATISHRLSHLHTNVNKNLIGIETRLQDLKSMLKTGSGGVHMVGIWGVGGAGKTTLAYAAYMEISHQFDACCLLENIRDESSKNGLMKLQEKFLFLITKETEVIGSEMEGKRMIKRKLGCKSVLVVFDDVNEREQLEALAGSHDWFGEGSRIIITTRDEHLLTLNEATIYEVSLLSDDEAIKLFSRHAFKKDEPVDDYKALSQEVVSYSGRLPLALEILGSFLYAKNKEEWTCALAKLKHIPNVKVMERLKISYDGLECDEKELFLDIACSMRRWEINDAIRVLDACSFHPGIGVKVLVQKSLIKVSKGRFDMHDLVEEMARYIVRGEHPDNPEKHSRIWKVEDMVSLCAAGAAAPETEVLVMRGDRDALLTFWHKKKSFRFPKPGYNNHQRLHNVIANMKKLRSIDWEKYPPSSFPSNFQPTRLGCLMLRFSGQKQLWKGCKSLPSLKILDLRFSYFLKRTPDFKGLPCLERLNLEKCFELKEIHPSIGYHKRLVWVNMKGCCKLKWFPPIIHMIKLETLVLSDCDRLKRFPDIQMSMDSLVNLHMDGTGDLFQKECGLEELSLRVTRQLPQFPRSLRKLNISHCELEDGDMPSDMSGLINLQVLDLSHNEFSRLYSNLSSVPCLKILKLSYCQNLVDLPDLPSSIAVLIAEDCESLQSVGDLSNCKCLWKVSLNGSNDIINTKLLHSVLREKAVHSMLQINAVEDRFMSMVLPHALALYSHKEITLMTLQFPHNWYNDYSGFLFSAEYCDRYGCRIFITQGMLSMESQPDQHHREEYDKNPESYKECGVVGYVPFGSLSHTSWWNNLKYTRIKFLFADICNPKVGLVPRKSKSRETPIHYSECCEEEIEYKKTFQIIDNPKSSKVEIKWSPQIYYE